MFDFLKAAFPWVIMGIAVIVLTCHHSKAKRQCDAEGAAEADSEEKAGSEKPESGDRMTEGMSIGMCFGAAIGSSGICDLATGISLGMLLGMVVGMYIKK